MYSKLTAAAFAAVLVAGMSTAHAQVSAGSTAAAAPVSETMIHSDQMRASKIIGTTVHDVQNRDIGKVSDLVLDKDGKVANVIVDVGGFLGMGGKYVAIKMSDIKSDNNRLTLDRSKEQLQAMAAYKLEDKNTGAGSTASPVSGGQLGTGATTTHK